MSDRRRKVGGRKQLGIFIFIVLWAPIIMACSGTGNSSNENPGGRRVSVDHPLDGRLICTQGETSSCNFVIQILAADASINPSVKAIMLEEVIFDANKVQLDNGTQLVASKSENHNIVYADLPALPHQEWREVSIPMMDNPNLLHSGCYVINMDAQDLNLPQKYNDELQLFVYKENGQLVYFADEQQFLNHMNASFHNGVDPRIAYDINISPEDQTRGELLVRVSGSDEEISSSTLEVRVNEGIIFEGRDNQDYQVEQAQKISSDTGSILPNGYRIVVIPFRVDLNSQPGGRTIAAHFKYQLTNSTTQELMELAPIGIGWSGEAGGAGQLFRTQIVSQLISDLGVIPLSQDGNLAGTNQDENVSAEGDTFICPEQTKLQGFNVRELSGSITNNYNRFNESGNLGGMTLEQFTGYVVLNSPNLAGSDNSRPDDIILQTDLFYTIPQCIQE